MLAGRRLHGTAIRVGAVAVVTPVLLTWALLAPTRASRTKAAIFLVVVRKREYLSSGRYRASVLANVGTPCRSC